MSDSVKAVVRARDDHRCTECGMTQADHLARYGSCLEVHRVVPGSAYTVDGCVTLCIPCHGPKPRRKPATKLPAKGPPVPAAALAGIRRAIRSRREAAGLNAVELSARAGLSRTAVYQIEAGPAAPAIGTLYVLAAALGCEVADFMP